MRTKLWKGGGRPVLARLRSSPGFIVATVSVAVFTDVFLYAVIVPVLPFALSGRIGIPEEDVQYWLSASLAVFAAALLVSSPIVGYIADRTQNRRAPMLFGLVLLLGTSLLLCFSVNIPMLLLGRVLQGMSASLVWSVGLALVVDTVGSEHIGEAMGWTSSAASLGILVAPMLGGVIYAKSGYYTVFAVCFGLIALDVVLRLCVIEAKDAKAWLGDEERERLLNGGDDIDTSGSLEDAPGTDATEEPISQSPMKLMHLLSKPRLLSALAGITIESSTSTCFDSTLPLFVSSTFGWDATGAGLIFLPFILPSALGPVAGAIGDRYGAKWPATLGLLAAAPLLMCLGLVTEDTAGHQALLCGLLAAIGLCTTFVYGPLMAEITWAIQEGNDESTAVPYALAYGLHSMSFSVGGILGPVVGGWLRDSFGWAAMGLGLGVLNLAGGAIQVTWTGGPFRLRAVQGV